MPQINLPGSVPRALAAQRPHEGRRARFEARRGRACWSPHWIKGTEPAKELDRLSSVLAILQPDFSVYGADEHLQPPRPYDSDHPISAVIERGLNAHVLRTG